MRHGQGPRTVSRRRCPGPHSRSEPAAITYERSIRQVHGSRSSAGGCCGASSRKSSAAGNCTLAGRPRAPVQDHTAIVIDDGIATGATNRRLALHASAPCRTRRRLVSAVPVAPPDTIEPCRPRPQVDEVVCPLVVVFLRRDRLVCILGIFASCVTRMSSGRSQRAAQWTDSSAPCGAQPEFKVPLRVASRKCCYYP